MNNRYIYKGSVNFDYTDVCVAIFGDTLEFDGETVINLTTGKQYKLPESVIYNLRGSCDNLDFYTVAEINDDLEDDSTDLITIMKENENIIQRLVSLGILKESGSCRDYNVGNSNYSKHIIQPWTIWQDYNLNPWDADIVKRILRTKVENGMTEEEARIMDYEKIIHICKERIRQLKG